MILVYGTVFRQLNNSSSKNTSWKQNTMKQIVLAAADKAWPWTIHLLTRIASAQDWNRTIMSRFSYALKFIMTIIGWNNASISVTAIWAWGWRNERASPRIVLEESWEIIMLILRINIMITLPAGSLEPTPFGGFLHLGFNYQELRRCYELSTSQIGINVFGMHGLSNGAVSRIYSFDLVILGGDIFWIHLIVFKSSL